MSRTPLFLLNYENADVSDDVRPFVTSLTYTDHLEDKSDELEINLQDNDRRWRELWYPSEGDSLDLKIGCVDEPLLPCGSFKVDEVEIGHGARTATIRALAVPVDSGLRTSSSVAYEDVTLGDVVQQVAARRGLTVITDGIEDIRFRRMTQANETDLQFLRRLGKKYGYAFSVRAGNLCFYKLLDLEAAPPVIVLGEADLLKGTSFRGKAQGTYAACEVSYLDPETGELVTARVEADGIRRGSSEPAQVVAIVTAPAVILRLDSPFREEVRDWQKFLAGKGMYLGAIDGIFGTLTNRGTREFQSRAGVSVDGVVGPITYGAAIDQGFVPSSDEAGGVSSVGDVLRKQIHVESAAEAEIVARSLLHQANRLRVSGTMRLEGRQNCVAGSTIELAEAGRLSGGYIVSKSVHTLTRRGGYGTQAEVNHV